MSRHSHRNLVSVMAFALLLLPGVAGAVPIPFVVDALLHSSNSGAGSGLDTGLVFNAGDPFTVDVDPLDLWNAGALPRWSNADGLTGNLFATGSDESGQPAGTLIGRDFGLHTVPGVLSAPFGTLVGSIGGDFFAIGTSFVGVAPASGTLRLYYWDTFTPDNTEHVTAFVDASPAPAPGTLTLTLLSLVALARHRRVRRTGG